MLKILFLSLLILTTSVTCTKKSENSGPSRVISVLDASITNLDPIHSTNRYASTVVASIFEGLYHYHYLKRPITLEPQLAENLPKISKDLLTYTIQLKKGVFFQDDPAFPGGKGREFNVNDVIYSWKRLADPKNTALGWWLIDGKVEGLNAWRDDFRQAKVNYDTPISGLKALDDYKLQITLTKPSFQFVHILATTPTMIVAREVVEKYGNEIINHPVGTGAFRLKKWVRNSEVQLVKNSRYRRVFYPKEGNPDSLDRSLFEDSGRVLPLSDEVIIKIFPERQPMWLSFLKGKLDHGIIPKDNYDQVFENNLLKKEFVDKGMSILYQHRPDVVYISLNMENPILGKNKLLRKALAAALDKDLILEKFYNKRGLISQGPLPPGIDGYDKDYQNPNVFNLELAKKYLAEAGYPDGKGLPEFEYDMPNISTSSRQFGEFLKDRWGQIGIRIKLQANTWPQFDKKTKTKKATMFDMAWMADYPDAENFLQLFYSKNISPGPNSFNFVNREYDELFEQFLTLPPGGKRNLISKKLINLINDEVPAIFLVHRIFRLPYHGWLKNYNEFPIIYDFLKYLRVDEKEKEKLIKKL